MKKWIAKLLKIKEQFNRIEAQQSVILNQNKDLIDEIKMNQGMILTKLNQMSIPMMWITNSERCGSLKV